MFCPKCGNELPNDIKFCTACGEKIESISTETGIEKKLNISALDNNIEEKEYKNIVKYKSEVDVKTKKYPFVIALIIIAILCIVLLAKKMADDNVYVCLSDEVYTLFTDISEDDLIEISPCKFEHKSSGDWDLLSFSPDGKYIYFYTKRDDVTFDTGTLCRAEFKKLKKNSIKNDEYIDIIATNAVTNFQFVEDDAILYEIPCEGPGSSLYYFDGESKLIADNVWFFASDGAGKIVAVIYEEEKKNIYGITTKNIEDKKLLASDISHFSLMDGLERDYMTLMAGFDDFENIIFTREYNDDTMSLCTVGFKKEEKEIAWNVSDYIRYEDRTYFVSNQTLYCYMNDEISTVCYDVCNINEYNGGFTFDKLDSVEQKYIMLANGTLCTTSLDCIRFIDNEEKDDMLYFSNDEIFVKDSTGMLSVAAAEGGTIDSLITIADDANKCKIEDSTIYYLANYHDEYCSFYSYCNGERKCLAKDIIDVYTNLYTDGTVLAYTQQESDYGYRLVMINDKGESTIVGNNVEGYIRTDKSKVIYISDGNVFLYDGKDRDMIESDARFIWSKNRVKKVVFLGNNIGYYKYYNVGDLIQ